METKKTFKEQIESIIEKIKTDNAAVSPVIGVVLMVGVTVIMAAAISAFVFGMQPPAQGPQLSLAGTPDGNRVTFSHTGGDNLHLSPTATGIIIDGSQLNYTLDEVVTVGGQFYLFDTGSGPEITTNTTLTGASPYASPGDTVTVVLTDVASQTLISSVDVNF